MRRGDEVVADAASRESIERARPLGVPFEQARIAQQAKVPAHSWLRLAEHSAQLGNGQLAAVERGKDAQAGRLTSRTQRLQDIHHCINISLCSAGDKTEPQLARSVKAS